MGGRYKATTDAINVWTLPWVTRKDKERSKLKGTFYVAGVEEHRINLIEIEEGFSAADMLHELTILEKEALGRVIHVISKQEQE